MTDYAKAREVAEQAREKEWSRPSFGKQLFLGDFRLDLIHPAPAGPTRRCEARARSSSRALRRVLRDAGGPGSIERDAQIPDEVVKGLAELGAFGMKIPEEYGGLGLEPALLQPGADARRRRAHPALGALLSAHQSIGVPQPVKLFGTDGAEARAYLPRCAKGEISAFLLTEPDVGSDPARLAHHRGPGRRRLRARRREAVDHQRRRRRPARRHGPRPRAPGDHRVRRRGRQPRASPSSTATRSWACAASRTA